MFEQVLELVYARAALSREIDAPSNAAANVIANATLGIPCDGCRTIVKYLPAPASATDEQVYRALVIARRPVDARCVSANIRDLSLAEVEASLSELVSQGRVARATSGRKVVFVPTPIDCLRAAEGRQLERGA